MSTSIDKSPIDPMILSVASGKWQKTALLISQVFDADGFDKNTMSGQMVADRIYVLVEAGTLEATGNIRRWRESNVRVAVKVERAKE